MIMRILVGKRLGALVRYEKARCLWALLSDEPFKMESLSRETPKVRKLESEQPENVRDKGVSGKKLRRTGLTHHIRS